MTAAAGSRSDTGVSGRTALLLCALLSVVHTWPIAWSPSQESLHLNADAEVRAWTLSWIAHALLPHPALTLALVGLVAAARERSDRRRSVLLAMVGVAGIVLSLGPATSLHRGTENL